MSGRHLRYLFNPASVALVGASERPGSLGEALARKLAAGGFAGPLYWVNPRHRQIGGRPAYRRLADLPDAPELAIIAAPAPALPKLLIEAGRRGVKLAVIATPHPATLNEPASVFRRALRKAVRDYGVRVLGPDAGFSAPSVGLDALDTPQTPAPGALALISQSQAAMGPLIAWANAQGLGFSRIVSLGESTDLALPDLLDGLIDDAGVRVVLVILESVERARPFLSAARALARGKPVLALRVGRGGDARARQRDALYAAAFRRAGVLELPSLRELFSTAATLALNGLTLGDRLTVAGNSRCLGLLAADTLTAENGHLGQFGDETLQALRPLLPGEKPPENPLDLGADAGAERYAAVLNLLLRERDADGVLVLYAPNGRASSEAVASAVAETVKRWDERGETRPGVLAAWLDGEANAAVRQRWRERGIPGYETPEDAVRAFLHGWRRQQNRVGLMATPEALPEPSTAELAAARELVEGALAAGRDLLEPAEIVALLRAYGIAAAPPESAPPVRADHSAWMNWSLRLIEDAVFGPVLLLECARRFGGLPNAPVALFPPLDLALAREAIRPAPFYRALCDAQAAAPGLLDSFLALLVKVSRLIVDRGEIIELELRSPAFDGSAATAQAVRLRLAATESSPRERLAIRPYPRELEETVALPDGSTLLIRPVKPEDEPVFVESFKQLSTEEVRMRFMHTVKELTHEEAARLTRIDYDREMALVVFRQRPDQPLESCGVARLMQDNSDSERAEFAIVLLRAATGIGLGSLLVRRLIRYARARGYRELFGEILRENEPMLALCRAMGFGIAVCPDDAGVMIARLPLA
ncbi:MAG: GNAT family N-acetyltransferase [Candidatus Competibacteraceae bacterium]|nr:GNAT family N-acetyltransferase [Candidatus Competibacteraceae bacterium]